MKNNYNKSLAEDLTELASQFKTQPRPDFLKSVLEHMTKNHDRDKIHAAFYEARKRFSSFPSIKELHDLASSLSNPAQSIMPYNKQQCSKCGDLGYQFAIHSEKKSEAIYGCDNCAVGKFLLDNNKVPTLEAVNVSGYNAKEK